MINSLSALLSPVLEADFWASHFAKHPLHIKGSTHKENHLKTLMNWQNLNDLLQFSPGLKFRLVHREKNYAFTAGEENKGLQALLQQGATLIIEKIDQYHPTVGKLCDTLSATLECLTGTNLYLSYPQEAAYPLHYDTHDLFVMQIKGQKRWFLEGETLAYPTDTLRKMWESPPDNPQTKSHYLLKPGDVMYIPRGHWHKAITEGNEPSLHLTLGLYTPTGLDILDFLRDQLEKNNSVIRAPLYPLPVRSKNAHTLKHAQTQIENMIKSEWQADFIDFLKQKITRRSSFNMPQNYWRSAADLSFLTPDTLIMTCPVAYTLENKEQRLTLSYQNKKLYFAPQAEQMLYFVLNKGAFTLESLYKKFPEFSLEAIHGLLLPLFQDNLLSLST